jgi:alanine dehydrogenase
MRVGVPREVLPEEYRVALVPSAVGNLAADGHEVIVETGAGLGAGLRMMSTGTWGRKPVRTRHPCDLSGPGLGACQPRSG